MVPTIWFSTLQTPEGIIHLYCYYLVIDTVDKRDYSTAFSVGPRFYPCDWEQYLTNFLIMPILVSYWLTPNYTNMTPTKWLTSIISVVLIGKLGVQAPSSWVPHWELSHVSNNVMGGQPSLFGPGYSLNDWDTEIPCSCRSRPELSGWLLCSRPAKESQSQESNDNVL